MSGREQPRSVRLEGVPARLFLESQNHQHDLIRELTLIDLGNRFDLADAALPHRLAALIGGILQDYSEVRSVTRAQALEALARGEETVTLIVPTGPGITDALRRWVRLVEEADRISAEGSLLTLPARPEVRALRRWYAEAITSSLREGAPKPAARYQAPRSVQA